MRNVIWFELKNMKFQERYLALYLDVIKMRRKVFQILILALSSGGALGMFINEYSPLIGIILVIIVQIISLANDRWILSDADIQKVSEMRTSCIINFNKLESLWIDYESGKKDDDFIKEEFYNNIRKDIIEIHQIDNTLDLPIKKRLKMKADEEANEYLKHCFFSSEEEQEEDKLVETS